MLENHKRKTIEQIYQYHEAVIKKIMKTVMMITLTMIITEITPKGSFHLYTLVFQLRKFLNQKTIGKRLCLKIPTHIFKTELSEK